MHSPSTMIWVLAFLVIGGRLPTLSCRSVRSQESERGSIAQLLLPLLAPDAEKDQIKVQVLPYDDFTHSKIDLEHGKRHLGDITVPKHKEPYDRPVAIIIAQPKNDKGFKRKDRRPKADYRVIYGRAESHDEDRDGHIPGRVKPVDVIEADAERQFKKAFRPEEAVSKNASSNRSEFKDDGQEHELHNFSANNVKHVAHETHGSDSESDEDSDEHRDSVHDDQSKDHSRVQESEDLVYSHVNNLVKENESSEEHDWNIEAVPKSPVAEHYASTREDILTTTHVPILPTQAHLIHDNHDLIENEHSNVNSEKTNDSRSNGREDSSLLDISASESQEGESHEKEEAHDRSVSDENNSKHHHNKFIDVYSVISTEYESNEPDSKEGRNEVKHSPKNISHKEMKHAEQSDTSSVVERETHDDNPHNKESEEDSDSHQVHDVELDQHKLSNEVPEHVNVIFVDESNEDNISESESRSSSIDSEEHGPQHVHNDDKTHHENEHLKEVVIHDDKHLENYVSGVIHDLSAESHNKHQSHSQNVIPDSFEHDSRSESIDSSENVSKLHHENDDSHHKNDDSHHKKVNHDDEVIPAHSIFIIQDAEESVSRSESEEQDAKHHDENDNKHHQKKSESHHKYNKEHDTISYDANDDEHEKHHHKQHQKYDESHHEDISDNDSLEHSEEHDSDNYNDSEEHHLKYDDNHHNNINHKESYEHSEEHYSSHHHINDENHHKKVNHHDKIIDDSNESVSRSEYSEEQHSNKHHKPHHKNDSHHEIVSHEDSQKNHENLDKYHHKNEDSHHTNIHVENSSEGPDEIVSRSEMIDSEESDPNHHRKIKDNNNKHKDISHEDSHEHIDKHESSYEHENDDHHQNKRHHKNEIHNYSEEEELIERLHTEGHGSVHYRNSDDHNTHLLKNIYSHHENSQEHSDEYDSSHHHKNDDDHHKNAEKHHKKETHDEDHSEVSDESNSRSESKEHGSYHQESDEKHHNHHLENDDRHRDNINDEYSNEHSHERFHESDKENNDDRHYDDSHERSYEYDSSYHQENDDNHEKHRHKNDEKHHKKVIHSRSSEGSDENESRDIKQHDSSHHKNVDKHHNSDATHHSNYDSENENHERAHVVEDDDRKILHREKDAHKIEPIRGLGNERDHDGHDDSQEMRTLIPKRKPTFKKLEPIVSIEEIKKSKVTRRSEPHSESNDKNLNRKHGLVKLHGKNNYQLYNDLKSEGGPMDKISGELKHLEKDIMHAISSYLKEKGAKVDRNVDHESKSYNLSFLFSRR